MKKTASIAMIGLAAALMACASSAMAEGRVNWSVNIGTPYYYAPPVVYSPPPVVYSPPPVVYAPRPVYYYEQPAPLVEYRYYDDRPWRGHGHHHHWRD